MDHAHVLKYMIINHTLFIRYIYEYYSYTFVTNGNKANKTGNIAEILIACILKENKIKFNRHHIIGTSVYGTDLKHDFELPDYKIIIEIKWQQVGGSADEKYPLLVANLKKQMGYRSIIIADGGGAKPKSIEWMRDQIDDKLVGVMSISKFIKFLNNGGLNERN